MVRESEEYKNQDDVNRERVESKNILENYVYSIKNSCKEENKTILLDLVETTISWIENNQNATKEEYDNKYKEVENIFNSSNIDKSTID